MGIALEGAQAADGTLSKVEEGGIKGSGAESKPAPRYFGDSTFADDCDKALILAVCG